MDQVDLPQRAAAVEMAGMQPGRLLGQLLVVAGRGKGQLADVILDVEVRVLDPVRLVEAERDVDRAGGETAGSGSSRDSISSVRLASVSGLGAAGRIEDADAADVAVHRWRLHRQKCGVQTGQLLHHTSIRELDCS